jgi:hypothetical protein
MSKPGIAHLKRKDGDEWERVVFAEVLIPNVPNVFGDLWSPAAVREAAYEFMRQGYGIDVDNDNVDVSGPVHVVESFIVRAGDTDFIEGSWVVAMRVEDDTLWQKILDNEINGYSYEATVNFLAGIFVDETDDGTRTGYTEPDPYDGHRHAFAVLVDANNRPLSGGTDEVDGHSHTISTHTVTDESDGHSHRFNLVTGKDAT